MVRIASTNKHVFIPYIRISKYKLYMEYILMKKMNYQKRKSFTNISIGIYKYYEPLNERNLKIWNEVL